MSKEYTSDEIREFADAMRELDILPSSSAHLLRCYADKKDAEKEFVAVWYKPAQVFFDDLKCSFIGRVFYKGVEEFCELDERNQRVIMESMKLAIEASDYVKRDRS